MVATLAPTQQSARALKFFNDSTELVCDLASRWLDESEYENINDYKVPLQAYANKSHSGVVVTKMLKRPFGFEFQVDGRTFKATITARGQYSYKRIA